jgi:4'-phosphopantetheinyl transferase
MLDSSNLCQLVGTGVTHSMNDSWYSNAHDGELPQDEVHLWTCWLDDARVPSLLQEYGALLTLEEHAAGRRLLFERDQHRHIVTRALLRTVLSAYSATPPRAWCFATNAYGKPLLLEANGDPSPLSFNLSHSGQNITLAITRGRAVGVDVEMVRACNQEALAARHFAPDEVAALAILTPHERMMRFIELWTLKESYLKATGTGLNAPLNSASFHFSESGGIDACIAGTLNGGGASPAWQFVLFEPRQGYRAAVCVEAEPGRAADFVLRRCVPSRFAELEKSVSLRHIRFGAA